MNYKLVAIDMDGTLLNDNHQVSDRTKIAIQKAKDKGVNIVLSTGRILKSALQYGMDLDIGSPIVACNGAIIVNEQQEIIYKKPMDKNIIEHILDIGKRNNIYYHFYDEYGLYANTLIEEVIGFYNTPSANMEGLDLNINIFKEKQEILMRSDLDILKFIFIDSSMEKLFKVRNELDQMVDISISSSWDNNIEIMGKNVSKGEALTYLTNQYNINSKEIIAIGDNENDLSMLEYAGLGVAMGNSRDEIKGASDYITSNNNEDGVAKVIEKFILGIGDEE